MEREKWQTVVADKDAIIADSKATIEMLRSQLAKYQGIKYPPCCCQGAKEEEVITTHRTAWFVTRSFREEEELGILTTNHANLMFDRLSIIPRNLD